MTNHENDNGPAIFKEEIVVEDHSLLSTEEEPLEVVQVDATSKHGELTRQHTGSSEEYVPEITMVEFDAFLIQKVEPQFETNFESTTRTPPHDMFPHFTADAELHEQVVKEIPLKPEFDLKEEYEYKIPKEGYIADKPFGVDIMSVRTEDEVSEIPDSEIASLMSERRVELERQDSDVSISDREYSDKDDENVVISDCDSDTESPFTTKQIIKMDDEKHDIVNGKSESSKETPEVKSTSSKPEKDYDVKTTEDLDDSFDETESLGAIPAKVYGAQYMQEINKLRDAPFIQGPEQYRTTFGETEQAEEAPTDIDELEIVKPKIYDKPVRHIVASEDESEESSEGEDDDSGKPGKTKKYILDTDGDRDKVGVVPEFYISGARDETLPDGDYSYGKGLPVPRLRLKRESSDSESDVPVETDDSLFDVTTDLETTVDLETTQDKGESPEAAVEESDMETPGKTTDDDSSTIKEEFMTHVDSLEITPEHVMEVREYVSSSEDEGQKAQHITVEEGRSESPEIHTGFSEELELSRITEDEEPQSDETSETDSTTSAESVRQVEIPTRDEILQTVVEESESGDVSMEVQQEWELSDTSFDIDESFNLGGPLARSTLVREQHTQLEVILG